MKLRVTSYELRVTIIISILSFILSGCVVRTYPVTKERVDQDLVAGNRGYLQGEVPRVEEKERKTTRTTQAIEIELHSPFRFEKAPKAKPAEKKVAEEVVIGEKIEDQDTWGNRGYITESIAPEIKEPQPVAKMQKYTVQEGDTLQKISQKFYGTARKWNKIYRANQDKLKGSDKIYPGQTIDIPVEPLIEPLKETQEKFK